MISRDKTSSQKIRQRKNAANERNMKKKNPQKVITMTYLLTSYRKRGEEIKKKKRKFLNSYV